MTDRTKIGLEVLAGGAVAGLAGNVLLRGTPWGLNAFLFVSLFAAGAIWLWFKNARERLNVAQVSLMSAMVFFAAMYMWRDSAELAVFNFFAVIVLMGVAILPGLGIRQRTAGVIHYVGGVFWAGISSLLSPFVVLFSDIEWKFIPRTRLSNSILAVGKGLLAAIPLLLIFGGLFAAADSAFESLVNRAFNFEADIAVSHIIVTSILAWLVAGYYRGSLIKDVQTLEPTKQPDSVVPGQDANEKESCEDVIMLPGHATVVEHINRSDPPQTGDAGNEEKETGSKERPFRDWQNIDNSILPAAFSLGTTEVVIVLGLVNVLFGVFVAMQVPYLFGGMELIQNTPDLKMADYARRGFGELVVVASLVLPMLLAGHWLLRKGGTRNITVFRILAAVQIALLFVVMASAVQRLHILTGEEGYGMTTVRFYPMVFMAWLAVVFLWFAATVLRNARRNFAWGALWAAVVVLAATNIMNPDAFIVRSNIALMQEGRHFDAWYNSGLSSDALPDLMQAFPQFGEYEQCATRENLRRRFAEYTEADNDIRTWNISRKMAQPYILENANMLDDRSENAAYIQRCADLKMSHERAENDSGR